MTINRCRLRLARNVAQLAQPCWLVPTARLVHAGCHDLGKRRVRPPTAAICPLLWRLARALVLLPVATKQHQVISDKITELGETYRQELCAR